MLAGLVSMLDSAGLNIGQTGNSEDCMEPLLASTGRCVAPDVDAVPSERMGALEQVLFQQESELALVTDESYQMSFEDKAVEIPARLPDTLAVCGWGWVRNGWTVVVVEVVGAHSAVPEGCVALQSVTQYRVFAVAVDCNKEAEKFVGYLPLDENGTKN